MFQIQSILIFDQALNQNAWLSIISPNALALGQSPVCLIVCLGKVLVIYNLVNNFRNGQLVHPTFSSIVGVSLRHDMVASSPFPLF